MKVRRPEIFVSATTADLGSYRRTITDALLSLNCTPVEQTHFPPSASSVRALLQKKISACDAVVHIAGEVYGAEPLKRDTNEPRQSYTQMEYSIANGSGIPVYVFICSPDFPYDDHEIDDDERRHLQGEHRRILQGQDHIYTVVKTREELITKIYQLQPTIEAIQADLRKSQNVTRNVILFIAIWLVLGLLTLPFLHDIRDFFRSPQERAMFDLQERGYSFSDEDFGKALSVAATDVLELFDAVGVSERTLSRAFAQNAFSFFQHGRGDAKAIEWFKAALRNGLDPHSLGLLEPAMDASNAEAILALLDLGVSPHSGPQQMPMLFPYARIITNQHFNDVEKNLIGNALRRNGAVFINIIPEGQRSWINQEHLYAIDLVLHKGEATFGFNVPETPSACAGRRPTPICLEATRRTGTDWCDVIARLPVRIMWRPERYDHRLLKFDIQYLLEVRDGRGSVLITDTLGTDGGYGILEVSDDLKEWRIYKGGKWSAEFEVGQSTILVDEYFVYDAFKNCTVIRPN